MAIDHLKNLVWPIRLPPGIRFHSANVVADGVFLPLIRPKELGEPIAEITRVGLEQFPLSTRVFAFDRRAGDSVILETVGDGLPLIVRRDGELIVNFDIPATRAFRFIDSKRPIYTYVPGFNTDMVPTAIRRPVSNLVQSIFSPSGRNAGQDYSKLALTSFEFVILLLHTLQGNTPGCETKPFLWPSGKRSVFLSLHDVDTVGFLQRRQRDPLFRLEQDHQIRSTWFIPTKLLKGNKAAVDFLLELGNEVGWHGHKHDHRLAFKPFADRSVKQLRESFLSEPGNYPTGMRAPKLLKSNYLYDLLERTCPALRYDTSFSRGIVPYFLWANGKKTNILEIPVTVPTDIAVYNQLRGVRRSRRPEAILEAQIARTKKLLHVGGIISIVTHPEKDLSERPEFLEIYDRYLHFIKSCPDIWFTTAGELYKYWTSDSLHPTGQA
jgi:peptidoglycan/xylan/chitin deacetylase (PgdA/CDA1 family)